VQHCPTCSAPIEPQSVEAIAARLLKDYRGKTITLSSPLIVARKGLYTALAKWARGKGFAQLRVDGKLLPTAKWPRLDRFVEHSIELPVATLKVNVAGEAALRTALDLALQHGKGVVHVDMESQSSVFSTKRACPTCGTGFPELDPRLFSFNSKHGWCSACFGTGLKPCGARQKFRPMPSASIAQAGVSTRWRCMSYFAARTSPR
jgi:excinuclease ABC subunit A